MYYLWEMHFSRQRFRDDLPVVQGRRRFRHIPPLKRWELRARGGPRTVQHGQAQIEATVHSRSTHYGWWKARNEKSPTKQK